MPVYPLVASPIAACPEKEHIDAGHPAHELYHHGLELRADQSPIGPEVADKFRITTRITRASYRRSDGIAHDRHTAPKRQPLEWDSPAEGIRPNPGNPDRRGHPDAACRAEQR